MWRDEPIENMPASPAQNPFLAAGAYQPNNPLEMQSSFESYPNRALIGGGRGRYPLVFHLVAPIIAGIVSGLSIATVIGAYLPGVLHLIIGSDVLPTIIHKTILFLLCWVLGPLLVACCCGGCAYRRRNDQKSCAGARCATYLTLASLGALCLAAACLAIPGGAQESFLLVTGNFQTSTWPAAGYCNATAAADALRRKKAGVWWHEWGADAPTAAAALARNMTPDERASLLNGEGYGPFGQLSGAYVGGMPAVPRLLLPSIHLQDAAQGFRTSTNAIVGQVTSWPSLLALASTWDASLARELGEALGDEFKVKGANVILGPSVNVHRMYKNGRNAEYLSGEEPYLGVKLVAPYVAGVQSKGIAANVKHYVLNHQESDRMTTSADLADRTLFEVYYPPFKAAVAAGVASLMCSYNRINGTHACQNPRTLGHLRTDLGFDGWVVSDWWATHDAEASVDAGLDVSMPGNDGFYTPSHLHALPDSDAKEVTMVTHLLSGMLAAGALDAPLCTAGCDCAQYLYGVNATSEAHVALARRIAGEAVVLLKNDAAALPLPPRSTLAVIGSACDAAHAIDVEAGDWKAGDYYVVGGSGRVVSDRAVSILTGLKHAGIQTIVRTSDDDVDGALDAAKQADRVLVCAGGTTSEDQDRPTLQLDQHALLTALAGKVADGALTTPLIVAVLAPGQVAVAPWADAASAVLTLFLGGQETGHGWADALTGTVTPSGKLPVTFVREDADAMPDGPCMGEASDHCVYAEGLNVAWRGLHNATVGFPFGHGLSYTTFGYAWDAEPTLLLGDAGAHGAQMRVRVTNTGSAAGAEVAQLYVRYPQSADEPDLVLRGFHKTPILQPGASHVCSFELDAEALSAWRPAAPAAGRLAQATSTDGYVAGVKAGAWQPVSGSFTMVVGSSSRDARLEAALEMPAEEEGASAAAGR